MRITSYKQLKVGKWVEIKKIPDSLPPEDKDSRTLAILTGLSEEVIDNLHFDELRKQINKCAFISKPIPKKLKRRLFLGGHIYVLKKDISAYSAAVYTSLKFYGTNANENLHHILAWIYEPAFGKADRAKMAKHFYDHASIADVYGAFFLFTKVLQKLKIAIAFSQAQATEVLNEHMKEVQEAFGSYKTTTVGTIH